MQEQIVRPVHGPGQHQVGLTVLQPVTGELDGVKRRGTGGVEHQRLAAEPQSFGQDMGGVAGGEAVFRIADAFPVEHVRQPDAFGEIRMAARRIGEIAEDRARPRQIAGPGRNPGFAQRFPPAMQQPLEQRVQGANTIRRAGEAFGIEDGIEAVDITAHAAAGRFRPRATGG